MKKIVSLLVLFLCIICVSCSSEKTVLYTVASVSADCQGVVPQKCMLVKKANSSEWTYFYDKIEGFDYQEGFEYQLEVKEEQKENVPADASSIRYILVKERSKEAKVSEGLPL